MDSPLTADPVSNGADATFMTDVVEASKAQPVIVDFWAPWCGPCKTLAPALEKNVRAANGAVKLVKINIDENPGIAGQMGVRSIPAVYAFAGGRPVDGFTGAIPESQIKMFVDRLAGGGNEEEIEEALSQAQESLKLGDIGGAAQAGLGDSPGRVLRPTDRFAHVRAPFGLARDAECGFEWRPGARPEARRQPGR